MTVQYVITFPKTELKLFNRILENVGEENYTIVTALAENKKYSNLYDIELIIDEGDFLSLHFGIENIKMEKVLFGEELEASLKEKAERKEEAIKAIREYVDNLKEEAAKKAAEENEKQV